MSFESDIHDLVSGFAPHKIVSSKPKYIGQAELMSSGQSQGPITIHDSIISSDPTWGCQPKQLYSSSETVGAPQLDL